MELDCVSRARQTRAHLRLHDGTLQPGCHARGPQPWVPHAGHDWRRVPVRGLCAGHGAGEARVRGQPGVGGDTSGSNAHIQ